MNFLNKAVTKKERMKGKKKHTSAPVVLLEPGSGQSPDPGAHVQDYSEDEQHECAVSGVRTACSSIERARKGKEWRGNLSKFKIPLKFLKIIKVKQ